MPRSSLRASGIRCRRLLVGCPVVGGMFRDRTIGLLRRMLGTEATFRPGPLEAVRALYEERRRVLVVQRTGWGKSAVYLIATRLLREDGRGPTLLTPRPHAEPDRDGQANRCQGRHHQLGEQGRLGGHQARYPA